MVRAAAAATALTPTRQLQAPQQQQLQQYQPEQVSLSPEQVEALCYERFMQYSGFGAKEKAGEIDGALFAKLCKETGIINKQCTKTDVDLIFTRAKPKMGRKLNYSQFQMALLWLGEKRFAKTCLEVGKEAAMHRVMELIAASPGPIAHATRPDFVKFFDDKTTYTGVHLRGGPTTSDNRITLSNLLDRSPSDHRGRKFV
jgi:hypothetical protein